MCIPSGSSSAPPPPPLPRWLQDTSNEEIVSKYPLSEDNRQKNASRRLARRKLLESNTNYENHNENEDPPPDPNKKGQTFSNQKEFKKETGLYNFASNELDKQYQSTSFS